MTLTPSWLLSISLPSLKSSYLVRLQTRLPNSFNITSPTFSPTLAYQEQSFLTEELPLFPSSLKLYGNNSLSKYSPPRLTIHKPMVRQNVPIKNLNNTFGSIVTISRITG